MEKRDSRKTVKCNDYGADIWVKNKKTKDKIRVVEMDLWRRRCKVTRTNGIKIEEIRNRMNVKVDIITYIEQTEVLWAHKKNEC